ncbi:hypothetical protein ERJ75_001213400 [Trypanosoma vivax]|nr:hypothetical protein ERJ75_001213400 [Trypanosoma vivax]
MKCPIYAVFLCAALAALCVGHSFGEYFQSSSQSDVAEYHQQRESNEQKFDPDSSARLELLEALVADVENKSSDGASGSSNVGSYDYGANTGVGSTGGNAGNAGGDDTNTDENRNNTGGVGNAGGNAGTGSKGSTNDGGEENTNNARDPDQTPKEAKDTTQTTYSAESTAGAGSNSKAEDGTAAVLSSGAAWFNIIMVLARAN